MHIFCTDVFKYQSNLVQILVWIIVLFSYFSKLLCKLYMAYRLHFLVLEWYALEPSAFVTQVQTCTGTLKKALFCFMMTPKTELNYVNLEREWRPPKIMTWEKWNKPDTWNWKWAELYLCSFLTFFISGFTKCFVSLPCRQSTQLFSVKKRPHKGPASDTFWKSSF